MVKEAEVRKLNGKTQYVDWETGEELFKRSDCLPLKEIEDRIKDLEKELTNEEPMPSNKFEYKFLALDFYKGLLKNG